MCHRERGFLIWVRWLPYPPHKKKTWHGDLDVRFELSPKNENVPWITWTLDFGLVVYLPTPKNENLKFRFELDGLPPPPI